MLQESESTQLGVDEHQCAAALGVSVHFLRRDRRGERKIPFFKLGKLVRYNLDRVNDALAAREEGGPRRRRVAS